MSPSGTDDPADIAALTNPSTLEPRQYGGWVVVELELGISVDLRLEVERSRRAQERRPDQAS